MAGLKDENKEAIMSEDGFTIKTDPSNEDEKAYDGSLVTHEPKGWCLDNLIDIGVNIKVLCQGTGKEPQLWMGPLDVSGGLPYDYTDVDTTSCDGNIPIQAESKIGLIAYPFEDGEIELLVTSDSSNAFAFLASSIVVGASTIFYSLL